MSPSFMVDARRLPVSLASPTSYPLEVSLLIVIGVAALLFVSTNIDDIFVLVTFFADRTFRASHVVLGQFLGIAVLVSLSLGASLLALLVPLEYIGLLGAVPFVLGAYKLLSLIRKAKEDGDEVASSNHGRIITVAFVTIANGGDNIGAYVPVFATRTAVELVATVCVFFAMTGVWCWLGHVLVTHSSVGPAVRKAARPVTPFVLMAIGILIIIESGAYQVVTR